MGTETDEHHTVHQRHDTSYRFLLSSKKLFVELLRSFVQKEWVERIDETNVQEIPHSFVLQDFKRKEADLVYRVKLNGQDVVFYLLLEMQSKVDFLMPYRLLLYQVEIWRYLMKDQEKAKGKPKTFRLPPIVPIVLYNGKRRWTASRQFRQLLTNETMFGSELLNFEYVLIDVARYTEEELLGLSNTIGSVFLLDQTADQTELLNRLGKLMHTIQQLPEDSQQQLIAWMANILSQKLPENEPQLRELIQNVKGGVSVMGLEKTLDAIKREGRREGRREGKREGVLEGKQEGKREAKEEVVKQMIAENLDPELIARVTGFSLDIIAQLREKSK
ncbi:Rpn family recombination-promoting nuclease/putative transposase [Paenibacillus thiaminolyticus]|uniref:Rpn family recombination-promoting nuclease/putative transposase n=2 Tax=Paenibacillus thiaminolyticus TaxID=49283 RepID=A0AAJ1G012_PANTH|nr:Rpn family recombination-promoting nuclease/putative transposase [Paenibacillus thiaminolyticus]MCY9538508.1 Rpn family recombination-promoting nuclease/putative transposase [Paenibacillus thiaminolyticus]MCY9601245.1 Rpn family recombination-promoting nuclease/putative transposase [Paenibacillus thiaminolyticus]MCY9605827.1 Rpn family recombination-promoting nuclease/putative transposase [Paenibacillus thiaminolyticus]MCY9611294.1 Rpn family recombination-promoting nuclease/putative transpo